MIQIQQFSKLFIEFFFDADVPWSSISFDGEAAAQPSSQGKDHQFPALWTWANGYLVDLMIIRDFLFLGFQYLDFMLDIIRTSEWMGGGAISPTRWCLLMIAKLVCK